jgi:type VI protein secretion system component VasK
LQQTGSWALFRLLNQGKLDRVGGGESYTLTLRQGDRQARFDLSAGTSHSPFDFELLTGFKCPALRP